MPQIFVKVRQNMHMPFTLPKDTYTD